MLSTDAIEDINHQDQKGCTALMEAVNICSNGFPDHNLSKYRVDCIKALIESGANVDTQNTEGRSALMSAAFSGSVTLVKELLRHGARVDITCAQGLKAMEWTDNEELKKILSRPNLRVVKTK